MATELTAQNFDTEVLQSTQPVLIDFYASWCAPCKMVAPIIEAVSQEVENARVFKVNIDEEPELANKFQIMSIPTLVVMKDGEVQHVAVGVHSKEAIISMLTV